MRRAPLLNWKVLGKELSGPLTIDLVTNRANSAEGSCFMQEINGNL